LTTPVKSIFEYDNYRTYLKDYYANAKAKGRKFSLQYFSNLMGFSAKSFFKHVMDGHRNLSDDSIERVVKALKLAKEEALHFRNLVQFNQATSSEERERYSIEILRSKGYRQMHPLKESQLHYFQNWYYVVVRELINLPTFKEDPEWIAAHTLPPITPRQAREALEELSKLGLIRRDESGKLVQETAIVTTADEVTSALLARYHREFMKKASESIDLVPRESRDISSVTFRVSEATARKFKEKVQKFRKELAEEASRDSHPKAIFQLNLQLFPVTQLGEDESGGGEGP
jgi:uncharacterized protein (TIGR02147 family)